MGCGVVHNNRSPVAYYYPALGPALPPPLLYWSYPTPPVSPAHYYHAPHAHHAPGMMSELVPVGGSSPLPPHAPPAPAPRPPAPAPAPAPPPADWPVFMVN